MIGLLGKKVGMTQIFTDERQAIPATVIEAGPCIVLQKKNIEKDKYNSIQLGFDFTTEKRVPKPALGRFKKANSKPTKFIREFIAKDAKELDNYELGQEIKVDVLKKGDIIDLVGTSKGRGFTGVMKRHNFAGTKATHGVHETYRHGGAIGQCATPAKVRKGIKMAGRHGNLRVTLQNVVVLDVQPEKNLLIVKGAVPGRKGSYVELKPAVKTKK